MTYKESQHFCVGGAAPLLDTHTPQHKCPHIKQWVILYHGSYNRVRKGVKIKANYICAQNMTMHSAVQRGRGEKIVSGGRYGYFLE
jgi:hypothetical protein